MAAGGRGKKNQKRRARKKVKSAIMKVPNGTGAKSPLAKALHEKLRQDKR